ncbi:MAG: endonuclease/exonuclease/phosphatase family protein [Rhodospirillales bacterium]|nr:endonuclease/exonuclease/phosphatase family protein [Rhodospirillales bacterium]
MALFMGVTLLMWSRADSTQSLAADAEPGRSARAFRAMTYNIHGGGPVTRGDEGGAMLNAYRDGRKMPDVLATELAKLEMDVIALQEMPSTAFTKTLAEKLGWNYAFFPGGALNIGRGWPEGIAAAIITPHKIVEKQNCPLVSYEKRPEKLFTRGFGKAVIDTGDERIVVFVAHLLPSWENTEHIRIGEISEITAAAKADIDAGRSVLVLGDMNHQPDTKEYDAWNKGNWLDTFKAKGRGQPLTCPAQKLTERIDYIFAAGPIAERLTRAYVLMHKPFAMSEDEEPGFALSDHLPVIATFAPSRNGTQN